MTALEFRSSPERVGAWRELLNNSLVAQAIVCLKDEKPPSEVDPHADAIVSVRLQARQQQHDADVNTLLSLAEPLTVEPPEEEPSWGIDKSQFQK